MKKRISFEQQYDTFINFVLDNDISSANNYLEKHKNLKDYFIKLGGERRIDYEKIKQNYLDNLQQFSVEDKE